jgi:hypothetical protein
MASPTRRVVSVSLGSSKGNKSVEAEYLGERFLIERIGTNGDMAAARQMIGDLDGKVDAIGLGGIDLYVVAAGRRYTIRDARRLARCARKSPVVDGSSLKAVWEPEIARRLLERGEIHPEQSARGVENLHVLLPSAVDRYGLAELFATLTPYTVYGDMMFALGIPIKLTTIGQLRLAARLLLPIICQLPFQWVYPTGSNQEKRVPSYSALFDWADVIAGDKHFITKYMPPAEDRRAPLRGKTVLTNTIRKSDIEEFRARGLSRLITSTPVLEGESLGTNAMESVIITILGRRPEEVTPTDYLDMAREIGWEPWVLDLD